MFFYEPLLCPRCKAKIEHINEIHKNAQLLLCKANKVAAGAFVYLLYDKTNNFLKIGYSQNPIRRYKEFVHATTNEIILIGYFVGSKVNETIVHAKFKKSRVLREWFQHDTEIIDYFTQHPTYKHIQTLDF